MNMKCVMTASIFALVSVSVAQAADMPVQERPITMLPQVVVAPAFSWTGFYLGGQIGGFSGNSNWVQTSGDIRGIFGYNEVFPKFSGFVGGLYAGSNVDFGNGFILGIDTDIIWSGAKAKASSVSLSETGDEIRVVAQARGSTRAPALIQKTDNNVSRVTESVTFSDKWSGATRVRLGFAFDRIMPYVAGGIAYSQIKASVAQEKQGVETVIEQLSGSKTLVGYTLGAGIDFAMTDSVILRAEYRYSDFGKKSFISNNAEVDLKTNDFRVGVAYKF
ncbi:MULTISPECIES: outer membrane protein [Bartonella]|uniref:outer membrane protein n=1 Tax=Bartonella TaxID=773 RepID=UPI001ABCED91|nr:outer membrane protein [Bartonella capreoli]